VNYPIPYVLQDLVEISGPTVVRCCVIAENR